MRRLLVAVFLATCASGTKAQETRAVVVYDHACGGRIVIETPQGYAVAQLKYGAPPSTGETLVGYLNANGLKKAYNVNRDAGDTLLVEASELSRKGVAQFLKGKCGR